MKTPPSLRRLRRTVRQAVHLLACLAALAGSLPARAQPAEDPKRFFDIKKWYVDYTIHVHGQGQTEKEDSATVWRVNRTYSGRYVVDLVTPALYPRFKPEDVPTALGRFMGWTAETKFNMRDLQNLRDPQAVLQAMQAFLQPMQVRIDDEIEERGTLPVEADVTEDYLDRQTWQGAGTVKSAWTPGVYVDTVKKVYCLGLPYLSSESQPTFVQAVRFQESSRDEEPTTDQHQIDPGAMADADPEPPSLLGGGTLVIPDQPLPPRGPNLSGSVSLPGRTSKTIGQGPMGVPVKLDISWTCSPTPGPDIELVVTFKGDGGETYENWAPCGGAAAGGGLFLETTPGNDMVVAAELRGVGTGEVIAKATKIRFELTGVSREKGVCMNAPPNAKGDPDPDLRFLPGRNPDRLLIRGNDGQVAEDAGANPIARSKAHVTSFDYGAWGDLKVTAALDDGRTIVGRLEGFKDIEVIPLPKRQGGSMIADCWLRDNEVVGKKDSADDEEVPSGDGSNGDGLTLYEEYRGFANGGAWTAGNPTRKDFFVCDKVGARSKDGLDLFEGITGLNVHDDLHGWEISKDRVVNFNHSVGPHVVDQHVVVLLRDFSGAGASATGGPGTPKDIEHVSVGTGFNPTIPFQEFTVSGRVLKRDRWAAVIAHELLHCCNVYHHGQKDEQVVWDTVTNEVGNTVLLEFGTNVPVGSPGTQIVRLLEDGTLVPNTPFSGGPLTVIVGVKQGQHSGAEDCVMRYTCAICYRSEKPETSHVRYMVMGREVQGNSLCEDDEGTGCNDPHRHPQSRYGDADQGRGFCRYQICVNDALTPPAR